MNAMIKVYADLITGGYKTIDDVPARLRDAVSKYLSTPEGIIED